MANPTATIVTTKGNIQLELFQDKTPSTVQNFIGLVQKGFYNGIKFHRVIPNFMVQTGCPQGTGTGGPGYKTDCEIVPGLSHKIGSLAMAHAGSCKHDKYSGRKISGNCSNGSQFYITHIATDWLDGVHTVFGQVLQGQDVVNAIQQGDSMQQIIINY